MSTKKYFNLLLITALTVVPISGIELGPRPKALAALLVSGIAVKSVDKAKESQAVVDISNKLGIDPINAGSVVALSGALYAFSFLANDDIAPQLSKYSKRAPLAAVVTYLATRKLTQSIVIEIPIVGRFLACPTFDKSSNSDKSSDSDKPSDCDSCQVVCKRCLLTKGVLIAAGYMAANDLIEHASTFIGQWIVDRRSGV